jgi:hypothetical protein
LDDYFRVPRIAPASAREKQVKLSYLDLEHAVPGEKPVIVEKYYVQKTGRDPFGWELWYDALCDGNIKGMNSVEQAREALNRTRVSYTDGAKWRIIKRIAAVTAEEVKE